MRAIFLLLAVSIFGAFCSPIPSISDDVYSDPICPGNIKNLWLDVVVVVRNTLTQVLGSISTIGPVKYPADPRSTCVGVVTYDDNATTQSQLDASKSFSDLYNVIQSSLTAVDSTNTSYLSLALLAAEKALKDGRNRTYRFNYKKVIIAFAADYQGQGTALDAMPIANRLKDNAVTIITVACTSNSDKQAAIQGIASPGFDLVDEMDTPKLVKQLTNALLSANCFCPEEWIQYRSDPNNSTSTQYGICVRGYKATGGSYGYQHAIDYCASAVPGAYLANEFSLNKHAFMIKYMETTWAWEFSPVEYFIGLSYQHNQWVWEQTTGQARIPLDPNGFSMWAPGYPQKNSTDQVIAIQQWSGHPKQEVIE
ncbi:hypothetical protein B9Z55_005654 [Caenorhabditis nigoni]|uniref:VWFA domain-containing protein n=1 Tax=Caenorhabditis nigoni TaxID=1611254 RepID=A0A2G5V1U2_9PELO|nr:hypothetical protein B9Z55_005654 [Caenorhabditis nigoni]